MTTTRVTTPPSRCVRACLACATALALAVLAAAPAHAAGTTASTPTGGTSYGYQPAPDLPAAEKRMGTHRLAYGSRGDEVTVLQMWLRDLGHGSVKVPAATTSPPGTPCAASSATAGSVPTASPAPPPSGR
jgi:hypothetical protein